MLFRSLRTTRFQNLRCLTVRFTADSQEDRKVKSDLVDFLKASNAPIEEFNLIDEWVDDEDTIAILSLLHRLKKLRIKPSNTVMSYLELPSVPHHGAGRSLSPCPLTEEATLDVKEVQAHSDNLSTIRSMILSRAIGVQSDTPYDLPTCLKKVRLLCSWEEEKIWTNIIKDFRDLGLVVEICRDFYN